MHEGNFTQKIVEAILAELKKHPAGRVRRVLVKVGEMFHLDADSVRAHYAALSRGTPLEEAELELKETPLLLRCRRCRAVGAPEDHHLAMCAGCGSRDVEVQSGDEIVIEQVEMDRFAPSENGHAV